MSKTSRINVALYGKYDDSLLPIQMKHVEEDIPKIKIDPSHLKEYYNTLKNEWGKNLWFTLHNSSLHYPEKANILCAERTKNFILGITNLVPVLEYKKDIDIFIYHYQSKLLEICSSRESLFKFFVDMHNMVNKKLGKKIYSYDEAYKLYA